jgi:hypothetical protein
MTQVQPPFASAQDALSLGPLAERISAELASLAQLSAEVQLALSLCHFSEPTPLAAIRGLQGIDRVTQTLEDLSRVMRALSGQIPAPLEVEGRAIIQQVRLHELATSLSTERTTPVASVGGTPRGPGEIIWF